MRRTPTRSWRGATSAVCLVAVAALGAGCSGGNTADPGASDSSSPTDTASGSTDGSTVASTEDFCAAYSNILQAGLGGTPTVEVLKDTASQLRDVGVPSDIPGDAKAGYDTTLGIIDGLPADAGPQEIQTAGSDLDATESANLQAFGAWVVKECAGQLNLPTPSLPTEIPTEIPTELPSDLPTDIPTEIPTELPSGLPS